MCKQTSALDLALQASIHCTVCYIVIGDLPEGVDPSFLAALPENIRQEVIAEQLRLQRIQARAQQQQSSNTQGAMEVNPEFLAALPPNIQEEVLAQQRVEQARLQAQQAGPQNNELDPANFLATLPPNLRQQVGILFTLRVSKK